jgi:peptide/nickel transport system ATP-binding protein
MSLLEVQNLSVRFGARAAVADLSFSLERGDRFGIVGESGSGKTLTAMAITGLLPEGARSDGTIAFDGKALPRDERAMARLRGKRMGLVFQEPMTALNPLLRVHEQIEEVTRINRIENPHFDVLQLLEEVGLEPKHGKRYPHQLSGGQRQRVMIAMALASEPDLLIADEPTSALDLVTQRRILDLIGEICARRVMTLLFISHDLKAVAALCERVMVMHQGRMVELGPTGTVFSAPRAAYTEKLVKASRFELPATGRQASRTILLEVEGVSREYRQGGLLHWGAKPVRAVDKVSFSIHAGECLALVGPSGCGKTTLAKMIVGLDSVSDGVMRLAGTAYHGRDLPKSLRRDMSLVFQDPLGSFNPRMRIDASLAEPLRLEPGISAQTARDTVCEAVLAVGLDTAMLECYPHEFSGGQRQRLAIARALVTRPKLLVLDEPVSALDVSVRGEVLALLARLRDAFELTYLLLSHDLDMVRAMADRVLVMEAGKIVEHGSPQELFARPQHRQTQQLVAARLPEIGYSPA